MTTEEALNNRIDGLLDERSRVLREKQDLADEVARLRAQRGVGAAEEATLLAAMERIDAVVRSVEGCEVYPVHAMRDVQRIVREWRGSREAGVDSDGAEEPPGRGQGAVTSAAACLTVGLMTALVVSLGLWALVEIWGAILT